MELALFNKTGKGKKKAKKKTKKKKNRRKQHRWFMVLHLKARNISITETVIFLSVKMGLPHYDRIQR